MTDLDIADKINSWSELPAPSTLKFDFPEIVEEREEEKVTVAVFKQITSWVRSRYLNVVHNQY